MALCRTFVQFSPSCCRVSNKPALLSCRTLSLSIAHPPVSPWLPAALSAIHGHLLPQPAPVVRVALPTTPSVVVRLASGAKQPSRWRFSRKCDWKVQVTPKHATKAVAYRRSAVATGVLYTGRENLKPGMPLFSTTLGLRGRVLSSLSSKPQGPILHELMPII
jgi:hypothetical protein